MKISIISIVLIGLAAASSIANADQGIEGLDISKLDFSGCGLSETLCRDHVLRVPAKIIILSLKPRPYLQENLS